MLLDLDRSEHGPRVVKGFGHLPGRVRRQESTNEALRRFFRDQIVTEEQNSEIAKKYTKKQKAVAQPVLLDGSVPSRAKLVTVSAAGCFSSLFVLSDDTVIGKILGNALR